MLIDTDGSSPPEEARAILAGGGVVVYHCRLSAQGDWAVALSGLTPQERRCVLELVHLRDRERLARRRWWRRCVLARLLRLEPEAVTVRYAPDGKPLVSQSCWPGSLCLSASSSRNRALLALALDRRVGVDIEWMDPAIDGEGIAGQYFAAEEARYIAGQPDRAAMRQAFYACWTAKEAWIKGAGVMPLDQFVVDPERPCVRCLDGSHQADRWRMEILPVAADYRATLVYEKKTVVP